MDYASDKQVYSFVEAPEVDRGAQAPQHFSWGDGLQAATSQDPQTYYQRDTLEPRPDRSEPFSVEQPTPPKQESEDNGNRKRKRRKWMLIFALLAISILALALGLGLGLGIKSRSDQPSAPSSSSTSASSSIQTSTASGSTSGATPVPTKGIQNDTYIAAVTTSDSNRHIFFQDVNGSIKHMVTAQSGGSAQWVNTADTVQTSSTPRNSTPLAVVRFNRNVAFPDFMHLFFINSDSQITATYFEADGGTEFTPGNVSIPVATNSTTLSISQVTPAGSDNGSGYTEIVLLYEAQNGNITILNGVFNSTALGSGNWTWRDVSDTVEAAVSDPPGTYLQPPLGSYISEYSNPGGHYPAPSLGIYFFNPASLSNSSICSLWEVDFWNWSYNQNKTNRLRSGPVNPCNVTSTLDRTDVLSYVVAIEGNNPDSPLVTGTWSPAWVQNQSLVFEGLDGASESPPTAYPYGRLAWLNDTNANITYVYHQLSDSVLVEDAFFSSSSAWKTTNITVDAGT